MSIRFIVITYNVYIPGVREEVAETEGCGHSEVPPSVGVVQPRPLLHLHHPEAHHQVGMA